MERLTSTKTWEEASWDLASEPGYSYIWQRLQQYENIGFDPEEIERILDEYGRGLTLRTSVGERLEIVREIPLDRLRELAQAEKEGRCVVLPCKQGDTVWRICGPKGRKFVAERKVVSVSVYSPVRFEIFTNCNDWLGETVFLTREEAEKALKERENNE